MSEGEQTVQSPGVPRGRRLTRRKNANFCEKTFNFLDKKRSTFFEIRRGLGVWDPCNELLGALVLSQQTQGDAHAGATGEAPMIIADARQASADDLSSASSRTAQPVLLPLVQLLSGPSAASKADTPSADTSSAEKRKPRPS